ncbi:retropepsin-like domain-containing protein [Aquimarina sp. D1M17]|uniref:retropepsin-like domain-containing protein n=1 Tax=Aquimarina acroporae TaxID=2937283 RepID=UPI0020BFD0D2|nr:retropepsin-like domain-containing protein [Aquimarina acroporae]MCK8520966.1 retropepsin-like domain-containing protein [Aquimarina acroporae]
MKKVLLCIWLYLSAITMLIAEDHRARSVFFSSDQNIVFSEAEILNEYTARIPFKLVDRLIVVEAELLNKKGNFIIDTGSETLILNEVHFPLKYEHGNRKRQTTGVIEVVDDTFEQNVKEFILQNFNLKNKTSDIVNLSHIERTKKMRLLGIIGYNILKDYEVFIDMHLNQITLSKVDAYGNKYDKNVYAEKIIDTVSFKLKNHTIVLEGFVGDKKVTFGLDTAAEFNQIDKKLGRKALKLFYPKKRMLLSGASDHKIEVVAGKLFRVRLSETIYFGPMNTILTNLNKMNVAFGTKLDGVLGYEFFQQKRTIINYQKEKLYFVNSPILRN